MCAFYSMKSVDDGITRRDGHKDLVGTVGDFFLPQSYTCVPPPRRKYKEYYYVLPTTNILKDERFFCKKIIFPLSLNFLNIMLEIRLRFS